MKCTKCTAVDIVKKNIERKKQTNSMKAKEVI